MAWSFKQFVAKQLKKIQTTLRSHTQQLEEIDELLTGYVPRNLRVAIARLTVACVGLQEAINESNSSQASCQAQATGNVNEEFSMSGADLSDEIAAVEKTIGVVQSATALISGFHARLDAAVEAALANGATAEQLQPLSDLSVVLGTSADELAAAVLANS